MNKNQLISMLVKMGFQGDQKNLYKLALRAIKVLKKEDPEASKSLADFIANINVGHSPLRSGGVEQLPVDRDSNLDLMEVLLSPSESEPIYSLNTKKEVNNFLSEREKASELIESGYMPPSTLLLVGEPGVGKTMLAEYIAYREKKPLVVLDLATSISSFLGKTGKNIKSVLNYAREYDVVLLLDEFDSIAKRRDDPSDLGELKRIVNVLLKELESWPPSSLLVAATNHPELLDRAIWRRFDHVLKVPMPGKDERKKIIANKLGTSKLRKDTLDFIANVTDGVNAADLCKMVEKAQRRSLISGKSLKELLITEAIMEVGSISKKEKSKLCQDLHSFFPNMKLKEIGAILDLKPSTVHYHLEKAHD